ncbi:hypothetical protein QAD02_018236 [Eretmocerus hayati]|uniref:Uncharacterized protein n=1 Tax=Eretmocerus hayati TaxID=131215 RepID=A0ACC2PIM5_9HYME|nr:hypothetical protein QAD02_018236 [Eretmocerus hayati]
MYVLQCIEDEQFCLVDNAQVICDHKTVRVGDIVAFYYDEEKYRGVVKNIGDDFNEMYEHYRSQSIMQQTIKKEAIDTKKRRHPKQKRRKNVKRQKKSQEPEKSSLQILREQEQAVAQAEDSIHRMMQKLSTARPPTPQNFLPNDHDDDILLQSSDELSPLDHTESTEKDDPNNFNCVETTSKAQDVTEDIESYPNGTEDGKKVQGRYSLRQRHSKSAVNYSDKQISTIENESQSSDPDTSFSADNSGSDVDDEEFEGGLLAKKRNVSRQNTQSEGRRNLIKVSVARDTSGCGLSSDAGIIYHTDDNQSSGLNEEVQRTLPSGPRRPSEDQLFGRNYPHAKMEHIGDDIWCKAEILDAAEYSLSPRICARKMMTGIFRECAVYHGVSSKTKRSAPPGVISNPDIKPHREVLHGRAVNAIIAHTVEHAKKKSMKHWPKMSTSQIREGMQQLCRDVRKAKDKAAKLGVEYVYGFDI